MYTIGLVQEKDIETLARIMSETFTYADAEKPWDKEHSLNYLSYCMKIQPDLFLVLLMKIKMSLVRLLDI